MMDPRIKKLAHMLINYSVSLKSGEKVFIEVTDDGRDLVKALVKEAYKVGAVPYVSIKESELERVLLEESTEEQIKLMARTDASMMEQMDAYIGIRGTKNASEMGGISPEKTEIYREHYLKPVHLDIRVKRTKWCVLRYPNGAMAQLADMAVEHFEDFYFNVCTMDYPKMSKAMDALVDYMNKTDKVLIKGKGTNLSFSIKDIPAIKCDGRMNLPDGEVFTAPVKNTVEGKITFNTPSLFQGYTFTDICLEFKGGKIIKATSNDNERLNRILDSDTGARYIGEFSLGVNPYITEAIKDTLFDEKISGSFHFTPGNAYDEASNGNESAIHWDLICIQTPEYGGGEIWFDEVLIRKDGLFVAKELLALNPENLK